MALQKLENKPLDFLLFLDAAASHLIVFPCKSTSPTEVISKHHEWMDTFQLNPKAISADMAFHHPRDTVLSNAQYSKTSYWTTYFLAKWSRNLCTTASEVPLGTRGHSHKKHGQDHSVTDRTCPVDAQSSYGEKHTSSSEWQDAYGVRPGKKTKRSHGPS